MEEMEEREAQPRAFQPRKVLVSGLLLLPKIGGLHRWSGRGGKDKEPRMGRKSSPSCDDDIQAVVIIVTEIYKL